MLSSHSSGKHLYLGFRISKSYERELSAFSDTNHMQISLLYLRQSMRHSRLDLDHKNDSVEAKVTGKDSAEVLLKSLLKLTKNRVN